MLLAGREEWEIDGTVYGEVAELRRPGDLPVGCDQCFDGVGADYTIDSVTTNGFRGRWTSRSIGVMLDRRGRELPRPSGYYCAVRRGR